MAFVFFKKITVLNLRYFDEANFADQERQDLIRL